MDVHHVPGLVALLHDVAAQRGLTRFVAAQNHYSLVERRIEDDVLPACERLGIGMLPYFPLASGLLTGKYVRGQEATEGVLERLRNFSGSVKIQEPIRVILHGSHEKE